MILFLILFCLHGPQTSYRKPLVTSRKQTGHGLHTVWVMAGGRKKGGNGETFMQNLEGVLLGMSEVGPSLSQISKPTLPCGGLFFDSPTPSKVKAMTPSA